MKWSKEQLAAIESFGGNVLVNAGAGSGKTSVLSEHFIYLLKKGVKLDRILVLTFAKLASEEMKNRIRQKIANNESGFAHLLNSVDAAHIETLDAFALFLVKKYHYALDLPKNINIMDEKILTIQKRKILDEIFLEHYKNKEQTFVEMVNLYIEKSDENIKMFILEIDKKIDLNTDSNGYIEKLKKYFYTPDFIEFVVAELFKYYKESLEEITIIVKKTIHNTDDVDRIIAMIDELLTYSDYDTFLSALKNSKFPTKPTGDLGAEERKKIAAKFNNLKKREFGYKNDVNEYILSRKKFVLLMLDICENLRARVDDFKKAFGLYTFADIQKMALELMRKPDICSEIKDSFDYILVDEYQDTSDIQEEMIKKLEKNNVFMVGDVKQSIYAFRNANCKIFQDKYNMYEKNVGGTKIDMNDNFRSREDFVSDLNSLFSTLMIRDNNIIDYKSNHLVRAGEKTYLTLNNENQHYGIEEIRYDSEGMEKSNIHNLEATIIVEDIISKINSGNYMVVDEDKKTNTKFLRPCKFKDFTIIMDRGKYFDAYKKIFTKYNIPLLVYNDEEISMSAVLTVIQQLLNLLNLSMRKEKLKTNDYLKSFVSLARSFLFEYDDQTIYDYVKKGNISSSSIFVQIEELKKSCENKTLKEIVEAVIDKFSLYEAIFKIGDYVSNAAKIEMVIKLASSLDEIGMNLADFVTYFEDIEKYKVELKLEPVIDSDDSVKIINIHKSKGLEFSICYFPGLYKEFYRDVEKKNFVISSQYGMSISSKADKGYNFLKFLAILEQRKSSFEERLRMFYVALTRTKEAAIIIREEPNDGDSPIRLENSSSFDDFLKFVDYEARNVERYIPKKDIPALLSNTNPLANNKGNLIIGETLKMDNTVLTKKRASSSKFETSSIEAMEFGSAMHYLLEIVDYETKDTSFIKDKKMENYVNKVLSNEIFKGVKNDELRHEFTFYDSKNNLHGIIDCLIIKENYIAIVDFKLKNITKEEYILQLKAYRSYIEQISGKPIKTYLLAIISGELEEIHENK